MNSVPPTDIIYHTLGLTELWRVTNVEMVPSEKHPERMEVHIQVDFREGSTFPCSVCGKPGSAYDTKQKVWRHLNFFQYRCCIYARVLRVRCEEHKGRQVEVPWAKAGSGFTLLVEAVLLTMLQQMPVSQVGKQVGEHDTRLWRLLRRYVEQHWSNRISVG
jgi:transposase